MQIHFRFNALGRLSRWVMLPVLLAAALGSAPLSTAHAIGSIITVDTLDGSFADDAGTGDCSLAEAIDNANNDGGGTPRLDCALGTGDDDIVFSVSGTITLTQTLPSIDDPQNEMTVIDGDGNITIDGSSAATSGIVYVYGYATFRQLILQGANDTCCSAGAVFVDTGGSLTIDESMFFNNYAVGNGGAIYNDGTLTVDRSTFSSNSAEEGGGAIFNSGTVTISNSTFYNNAAAGATFGGGGGAIDSSGTATVYSSTFSDNSSLAGTGAAMDVVAGTTYLYNSILANSSSGFDCDIDSGTVGGSYNLIEDDNCGFTDGAGGMILGDDPRLGALVSVPAYFTLLNDSPALDAGNNSFAAGSVDEPGNARTYDVQWAPDTGSGTPPIIDLGAYENQVNCPGGSQLYVDDSAGGQSSGTSWTDAFPDLQMALYTVKYCGSPLEVWVAGGLYKPDGGIPGNQSESFVVPPDTRLYGGFNGTESSLGEQDPGVNVTILSGDIDENDANAGGSEIDQTEADIAGSNSFRVVYMNGSSTPITSSTVLDGFTITGGDGVAGSSYGGGMLCFGTGGACSPTLSSLTFSGNQGTYGGALMNESSSSGTGSPILTDVTFSGNFASGGGGAIYNYGAGVGGVSSPSFTNVTFYNNSAHTAGAMWNDGNSGGDSSPTLTNVTFKDNFTTVGSGGALYNGSLAGTSNPTLINVILWGNTAAGTGDQMQNETGAAPTISYSVVEGGDAGSNMGTAFSSGTANWLGDPKLGPLQDNGGYTATISLGAASSAIDTGDGGSCPATDQRGAARQGAGCDIGAYEAVIQDTVGIAASGTFYLRNSNTPGPANNTFGYGWAGPAPLVGDWDGDGVSTVGIDDAGWFFLRNTNSAGAADMVFQYGWAGATPLLGDWDGDGTDTVGIYSSGSFFLRNSNSAGPADMVFTFGWAGPTPLVGDWDGDGVDTIGIYDPGSATFFLRNSNTPGPADMTFGYGWAGPTPIVGDWNGDRLTTVGIDSAGMFFLRNSNSAGPADATFSYGFGGATPLAGTWDLLP